MSYTRPNNRGVLVGRLKGVAEGRGDPRARAGCWMPRTPSRCGRGAVGSRSASGRCGIAADPLRQAPAGEEVGVALDGARLGRRQGVPGRERLASGSSPTHVRPGRACAEGACGHAREASSSASPGHRVTAVGGDATGSAEGPEVEPARTKALTAEEIMEHVGRMGSTPFVARAWDVELQPGAGMGFSVLHRTRREALEALEERAARALGRPASARAPDRVPRAPSSAARSGWVWPADRRTRHGPRTGGGLSCGRRGCGPPRRRVRAEMPRSAPHERVALEMPRIAHRRAVRLERWRSLRRVHASSTPTLGLLAACVERGAQVEAHWGLNVTNAVERRALSRMGARRVWLSPELRLDQMAELIGGASVASGVAVYGRQELMVTQHCVLGVGGCSHGCALMRGVADGRPAR